MTVQTRHQVAQQTGRLAAPYVEQFQQLCHFVSGDCRSAADGFAQPPLGGAGRRSARDAEDARHDHVERDRLHRRHQGERTIQRPAVDLSFGRVGDHGGVPLDRLPVEGWQQQLALAHVFGPREREHRVRSHDRTQRRLARERRGERRVGGEERADVVRVAGDDVDLVINDPAKAEHLAQLTACAEHELDLPDVEAQRLRDPRQLERRR